MLKIQVWLRDTNEYNIDTIDGPKPNQTQEEFEKSFLESEECYLGGDVYEICPYFDFKNGRDSIAVYLGGTEHIENKEEPVFKTSNWEKFEFVEGGSCNYIPSAPEKAGKANIWWYHDMKFNNVYYWSDISEFDPKKLSVQYGIDQDGRKYLEDLIYDGQDADDFHDYTDVGYGYTGPEFVYREDVKFRND